MLQGDVHVPRFELFGLALGMTGLAEEGAFQRRYREQHRARCPRCAQTWATAQPVADGPSPALVAKWALERARAAVESGVALHRSRSGVKTISAGVLDAQGEPVLRDGRWASVELGLEKGRVTSGGHVEIVLEVPRGYSHVRLALQLGSACIELPETRVSEKGRAHVEWQGPAAAGKGEEDAPVVLDPELLVAWVRQR